MSPRMEISQVFLGNIFQGMKKVFPYIRGLHVQLVPVVSQNAPGRCEGRVTGSAARKPSGLLSGGRAVISSRFPMVLQTAKNSPVSLSSPVQ